MSQKNKKPKMDHLLTEVEAGFPDSEFYKGDFLPEITPDPPLDSDIYRPGLVKELIPGISWRKSEQDSDKYNRQTGREETD